MQRLALLSASSSLFWCVRFVSFRLILLFAADMVACDSTNILADFGWRYWRCARYAAQEIESDDIDTGDDNDNADKDNDSRIVIVSINHETNLAVVG